MSVRLSATARREQILDIAVQVFAHQGFHGTSMNDVAVAAGVTKPVLYQHFASKRDLYMPELPARWAAEIPGFTYVPVLSEALPEDAWTGRTGFVHQAVMQDFPDMSAHQVYACGAPIVIESARRDFTTQCRLPEDAFYSDAFSPSAPPAA